MDVTDAESVKNAATQLKDVSFEITGLTAGWDEGPGTRSPKPSKTTSAELDYAITLPSTTDARSPTCWFQGLRRHIAHGDGQIEGVHPVPSTFSSRRRMA